MPVSTMQLGRQLAETLAAPKADGVSVAYGTVAAIREESNTVTLDVTMHGSTLYALPMLTSCRGVTVGDRVMVTTYGHLSTVTGVIAHSNEPDPVETYNYAVRSKTLWSGGPWYLNSSQTIRLSEEISRQAHGIVVCWRGYVPGEGAKASDYAFDFIPKNFTAGYGIHHFSLGYGSRLIRKYYYVANDNITGNDVNSSSSDSLRIGSTSYTIDNRYSVVYAVRGI